MSDDQTTTDAPVPKKKGGWPRGRPRPRKDGKFTALNQRMAEGVAKMGFPETGRPDLSKLKKTAPAQSKKYGRLHERLREGFEGGDNFDAFQFTTPHADRFKLDPKLVDDLAREGIALQWFAAVVMGQEQTHAMAAAEKNGWSRVMPDEIPEINMTESDGMVLMARPMAIHRRALQQQDQDARDVLENQRRKHQLDGVPRVSGAREARRSNFHNRSMERLDIP
jgi:hypothetical protein